jgi:hypothetical protein
MQSLNLEFTMAGNQTFLEGIDTTLTYSRKYEAFGGSDDLRKKIFTKRKR